MPTPNPKRPSKFPDAEAPDFELTSAGLSLHPDTEYTTSPGELWNTLRLGLGLRAPVKYTNPGFGLDQTQLDTNNPLHLCEQTLFAPLSPEDYANALEYAYGPEAVRVIHLNLQYLEQHLSAIRSGHTKQLWGYLRSDGRLAEVQFLFAGRTWRWHHALGFGPVLHART